MVSTIDKVFCTDCAESSEVAMGSDICPECGAEGTLQWDSESREFDNECEQTATLSQIRELNSTTI